MFLDDAHETAQTLAVASSASPVPNLVPPSAIPPPSAPKPADRYLGGISRFATIPGAGSGTLQNQVFLIVCYFYFSLYSLILFFILFVFVSTFNIYIHATDRLTAQPARPQDVLYP